MHFIFFTLSHCTFLCCNLFVSHSFLGCILLMMDSCHIANALCWRTFPRSQFLDASLFSYCTLSLSPFFFGLSFFHNALFSCCAFFVLFSILFKRFHVPLFSYIFLVSCCTLFSSHSCIMHFFMMHFLHSKKI